MFTVCGTEQYTVNFSYLRMSPYDRSQHILYFGTENYLVTYNQAAMPFITMCSYNHPFKSRIRRPTLKNTNIIRIDNKSGSKDQE